MRKALLLGLSLLCLLILSCDFDDAESLAQKEIRDILYDVSLDFNLGNVQGLMDHVHQDYLHKGEIILHLNNEILDRLARFQLLEIEVLYIEISGDYAVAHTRDHYQSDIESVTFNEPEDHGYFSYFHRSKGSWLIYGDHKWVKQNWRRPKITSVQGDIEAF